MTTEVTKGHETGHVSPERTDLQEQDAQALSWLRGKMGNLIRRVLLVSGIVAGIIGAEGLGEYRGEHRGALKERARAEGEKSIDCATTHSDAQPAAEKTQPLIMQYMHVTHEEK